MPYGRTYAQGTHSGEALREKIESLLRTGESVTVDFDGTYGVSPSFLEEVFGGLARSMRGIGLDRDMIRQRLKIESEENPVIVEESWLFFHEAAERVEAASKGL